MFRILLTNDDGIHAPGLKVMEEIAAALSDDVWVVAPETEQSGAGHSLTLTEPLRVRKIEDQRYAIKGTPTDCIMMACLHIIEDKKPDLVLSGVNRGANLGEDVTYSGTVAAAMEGTLLGIPSIALSQIVGKSRKPQWDTATAHGPGLIARRMEAGWPKDVLLNVNFPAVVPDEVAGLDVTSQGRRDMGKICIEERVDPRGFRYHWYGYQVGASDSPSPAGTDVYAVRADRISVTPLHLDLTHNETVLALEKRLGEG